MTVSSNNSKDTYSGNGSTTVFAYTFKILDEDEILVTLVDSDGAETVQTKTTHYTVSNVGEAAGGNVTMVTAPASGETLVLQRSMVIEQQVDYVENDAFPADTHEQALDRLTMIAQEYDEKLNRTVKLPITSSLSDVTIADGSGNASKYLRWNSTETAIEAVTGTPTDAAPAGANGQFQYNNAGTMAADTGFTTNGAGTLNLTGTLSVTGSIQVDGLNFNGFTVTATGTNSNLVLTPDGTGVVVLDGLSWPGADGTSGQVLQTNGSGTLSFKDVNNLPVRAYQSGSQAVASGAAVKLQLDAESFDVPGTFDSTTNYRHTPTTAGYYKVCASVRFSTSTALVNCLAHLYKNGSVYSSRSEINFSGTAGDVDIALSDIIYCNGTTDYIEVYVQQGSGASMNVSASNYTAYRLIT